MDPNIQVAFISVLATFVTTSGVVLVAVINNRRERAGAASAGVEAVADDQALLDRIVYLVSENERKERRISELLEEVRHLKRVIRGEEHE